MATQPPNLQREMEFIWAWVKNLNANSLRLIDWPSIGASLVSEYVTPRLLDMAFPTLFSKGYSDWLEPQVRRVNLNEYVKHLI